jgi:spermidine synthase
VLDAGTQVMGGLIGALVHPTEIKRAMVVGLGTGTTAGWLGVLPNVEAVDAVELEPAILEVARICAPVNADVMNNPRVHVSAGDAREVLLTTPHKYDLIFSEPSNPYRAGVASLFTKEFYEAIHARLEPGGVFVQWIQAYEIDARSVRNVYTTLSAEFASVETWRTKYSDLIMIARDEDVPLDLDLLKKRITEQPYREALMHAWRVNTVEGVLAHFVAQPGLARAVAADEGPFGVNTDDRNQLEFSIARTLGRPLDNTVEALLETAVARNEDRPVFVGDGAKRVDWENVVDHMVSSLIAEGARPVRPTHLVLNEGQQQRFRAQVAWARNRTGSVLSLWGPHQPRNPVELMVVADALSLSGDGERAEPLIAALATMHAVEANAIRARLLNAQGKYDEAWQALLSAFTDYRTKPWANNILMGRIFPMVYELTIRDKKRVPAAKELLSKPLSLHALDYLRIDLRLDLGLQLGDAAMCTAAVDEYRGHNPWERSTLERVLRCHVLARDPRQPQAEADLEAFLDDAGTDFGIGLIDDGASRRRLPVPMPSSAASASASAADSAAPASSASAAPSGASSVAPAASVSAAPPASAAP